MDTDNATEVAAQNHCLIINHCRILQILSHTTKHFQRIFKERWLKYQKLKKNDAIEWNDTAEDRMQLIELCTSATPQMKASMKIKNFELWDVTLVNCGIQSISSEIRNLGGKTNKKEDVAIHRIREIRNKVVHEKPELTDDEFLQYFDQISKFMIKLGDTQSAMDELKNSLMKIGASKIEPPAFFGIDSNEFEITGLDEAYNDLSELLEDSSAIPGKKTKLHMLKFHEMPNIRKHKSEQALESSHKFENQGDSKCTENKKHRLLSFFSFLNRQI